jgi:hypothetical protein
MEMEREIKVISAKYEWHIICKYIHDGSEKGEVEKDKQPPTFSRQRGKEFDDVGLSRFSANRAAEMAPPECYGVSILERSQ